MANIETCHIEKIDKYLLEWLDQKKLGEPIGKVHSIFDKVINFVTHDGTFLFSLAKRKVIQSPKMMKTGDEERFSDMCKTLKSCKTISLLGNKSLKIGDLVWDFSKAEVCRSDIKSLPRTKPEIALPHLAFMKDFIYRNGAKEGIFPAWKSFNDPKWEVPPAIRKNIYFPTFLQALHVLEQEVKEGQLKTFIEKFAGLGIGLTPSGDDFLTGLLAVWQYFEFPLYKEIEVYQADWLRKLKGRTTDVGYFMLKNCLQGQVNEALLDLLENLDNTPDSHLQSLLAIGSTSGTDMLAGVSFAYQQLVYHKEEK